MCNTYYIFFSAQEKKIIELLETIRDEVRTNRKAIEDWGKARMEEEQSLTHDIFKLLMTALEDLGELERQLADPKSMSKLVRHQAFSVFSVLHSSRLMNE